MKRVEEWKKQEVEETMKYLLNIYTIVDKMLKDKEYDKIDQYHEENNLSKEVIKLYNNLRWYPEDVKAKVQKKVDKHFDKLQKKVEAKIGKILEIQETGSTGGDYIFKGENGNCKIEIITAGGYNIQRRHTRWLIK